MIHRTIYDTIHGTVMMGFGGVEWGDGLGAQIECADWVRKAAPDKIAEQTVIGWLLMAQYFAGFIRGESP